MKFIHRNLFICIVIVMTIGIACNLPLVKGDESEAEKTLQAISVKQTIDAYEQATEIIPTEITPTATIEEPSAAITATQEETILEPTATIEIIHTTKPGEPGWVSQWGLDTDSSRSAAQNRAIGGDYLNKNLLERPFTSQEMLYYPDVDLGRIEISKSSTFFYFTLHLNGLNNELGILAGHYGVEIDLDRDGRGDILLWVIGDGNQEWNIDNVFVYTDSNNDVGGRRPMIADAPGYSGDGYDQLLFSPDDLDDPDAAWKRVDPADASVIQLAIKKSLLKNSTTFLWNGWADNGVSDPAMIDYNDVFTLSEAGSPLSGSANYPLNALYLTDNTCRLAYGFEPTGDEPGVCPITSPAVAPTAEPPPEEPQQCICSDYPNQTFIDNEECCVQCGYVWYGTQEFPCDLPAAPPPCNCSDFLNYTFITDSECCTYCGYTWTGSQEFPCIK